MILKTSQPCSKGIQEKFKDRYQVNKDKITELITISWMDEDTLNLQN